MTGAKKKTTLSTYGQMTARLLRSKIAFFDFSQAEIAENVGISQSQLSKILRAERPLDIDVLLGILISIGIDPSKFITELTDLVIAEIDAGNYIPANKYAWLDFEGNDAPIDEEKQSGHKTYFNQNSDQASSSDESDADAMLKSFTESNGKQDKFGTVAYEDENKDLESRGGDGR